MSKSRDQVIVCRCESLRQADLDNAIADGASSISDLKRRTRLGMGPCQGIYCLPALSPALHAQFSRQEPMTYRPPARSVSLRLLAASDSGE